MNCNSPVQGYNETQTCIEVPSKPHPAELPFTGGEAATAGGMGLVLLVVGLVLRGKVRLP